MKVQIMNSIKTLLIVIITMGLFMFQSCENLNSVVEDDFQAEVKAENIRDLTASDLESMKEVLKTSGIDLDDLDIYSNQTGSTVNQPQSKAPSSAASILVKAIKVTTTTKSPDGSGATIPVSGVLLVPRINLFPLRLLVVPAFTYTHFEDAPSILFKTLSILNSIGEINYLFFLTLQATQGFAVLITDYPGFGDSYQKAFIPYLLKEPMVTSSIDLIKAAQETLKKNKYNIKKELILSGYSLGAYVSAALAEELDTNADLPVKLTVAGGTPLNLMDMFDFARKSDSLSAPFIYPLTVLAYAINENYPTAISEILKAPYDRIYLNKVFDGTHFESDLLNSFSTKPSELFTDDVITQFDTHSKFEKVRGLLNQNSVNPWKSTNKLVLIHGISDDITPYQSTKTFYNKQKELGGNITLCPILGTGHILTVPGFYFETMLWINAYR